MLQISMIKTKWAGAARRLCRVVARREHSSKASIVDQLQLACGGDPTSVLAPEDDVSRYSSDWTKSIVGMPVAVVRPSQVEHVQEVVRAATRGGFKIVPQGGNTGLVGGSVPIGQNEVVLSLERLNKIRSVDPDSGVVVAEAGVVLDQLDTRLREDGYCAPLDLGSKGSCQIGGNVSTNAGGLRLCRFGSLHGSVLGVEVISGTGARLDLLSELRKDNTGYSLKDLFIGSEGTLGIITAVSIAAPRLAPNRQAALLACGTFDSAMALLRSAKERLQGILSAIEFFDAASMEVLMGTDRPFVVHRMRQEDGEEEATYEMDARAAVGLAPGAPRVSGVRDPLGERYPFYVLVETRGVREDHDAEVLESFLSSALASGRAETGVFAQNESECDDLFGIREGITSALTARGPVIKFDLSFPRTRHMYRLVDEAREWLRPYTRAEGVIVCGYGHLGDNNLHLNVSVPAGEDIEHANRVRAEVKGLVYDRAHAWAQVRRGSISAEHGLGSMKNHMLPAIKSPEVLDAMRQVKAVFDPLNVLSPGRGVLHPDMEFDHEIDARFQEALHREREGASELEK